MGQIPTDAVDLHRKMYTIAQREDEGNQDEDGLQVAGCGCEVDGRGACCDQQYVEQQVGFVVGAVDRLVQEQLAYELGAAVVVHMGLTFCWPYQNMDH